MRDYKGWTAQERQASFKKTKAAIAAGIIPPPTKCNRCGKTTGRIDYHNHDYSDPIKFLEQICQGCHTRLHRLENKMADATVDTSKEASAASMDTGRKVAVARKQSAASGNSPREEMHRIRVAFTKALGLDWSENPNPNDGYKQEFNTTRRSHLLDEAKRLRNEYASMVVVNGTGSDILAKMDRNLANCDRQALWK